jgi:hypothetical protein
MIKNQYHLPIDSLYLFTITGTLTNFTIESHLPLKKTVESCVL